MRKIVTNLALVAAFCICLAYLAKTHDPQEFERIEQTKDDAVEYARKQAAMRKKMARIHSETRMQIAEAGK